jgi:hypothetical protein
MHCLKICQQGSSNERYHQEQNVQTMPVDEEKEVLHMASLENYFADPTLGLQPNGKKIP